MKFKYILFIVVIVSCQNKTSEKAENEYAFEDIKYKTDNIVEKPSQVNQKLIRDENKKDQQNKSLENELKRDSIRKVINHNIKVRNKLIEYYKSSSYLPSTKFDHLKHIRNYSTIEQIDGETNKPKYFIDYIIENQLEQQIHKKYLTDRKLLRKLKNKVCENSYVSIEDTLTNGMEIEIILQTQKFNIQEHKLKFQENTNYLIEIDGKYPFGAIYTTNPNEEITELAKVKISIDKKDIESQIEEYQNLYDPKFCSFGRHKRITEAYEDGENIYLYIFGGVNADSYFAKLIFDLNKGYVGKIVTDYVPLSMYGSFGEHFIGY